MIICRLPLFVLRDPIFLWMLLMGGCWMGVAHTASVQSTAIPDSAQAQLDRAERAWLDRRWQVVASRLSEAPANE